MKKFWEWLKSLFKTKYPDPPKPEVIKPKPGPVVIESYLVHMYRKCEIRPERLKAVAHAADKMFKNKDIYKKVEDKTGVPWWAVGGIHHKEASMDFKACLHNGERIIGTGEKTVLVPKGKGPFNTWEEAAVDALGNQKHKKWDLANTLDFLERYNGLGYRKHKIPTPYLFAGTTVYEKGGYPRDHVWDENHVVKNVGIAAIMKHLKLFEV